MGSKAGWSLPNDSQRVRTLLYLSEGLILGAGGLLLAIRFSGAYLVDVRTGTFDPHISPFGVLILLFLLFLALRGKAILDVTPKSPERPAELQNWWETREWRWGAVIALAVGGLLLAGALMAWSWWEIVFLYSFDLLLLGMILAGILLYVFVLHKIGM